MSSCPPIMAHLWPVVIFLICFSPNSLPESTLEKSRLDESRDFLFPVQKIGSLKTTYKRKPYANAKKNHPSVLHSVLFIQRRWNVSHLCRIRHVPDPQWAQSAPSEFGKCRLFSYLICLRNSHGSIR